MPIISKIREPLEGNIFMEHETINYTKLFESKIENICYLSMNENIKNIVEIGFNSGFSTLLMLLSNPNTKITCFDICCHRYTIPCYERMKQDFGDRINLIAGDSTQTLVKFNETQDLIHIDGGHDVNVAWSDMINSFRISKNGTIIIMDDVDCDHLNRKWNEFVRMKGLVHVDVFSETIYHDVKRVALCE